jgi:hypothetical protein
MYRETALIQPVTREESIAWAWLNGMAGVPPAIMTGEDGLERGILRGHRWRLIFPAAGDPEGEILLITSGLPAVAGTGEQS